MPGVGDDDGRLGVAAPPRVVVDDVVLDGDVVALVDADPAVGAVVHSVVVDEGVVAGPDGDSPSVARGILSAKQDITFNTTS